MNRLQTFLAIRRHQKLAVKRSINYNQNRAAKFFIWFMSCFVGIYLVGISIMLALIANESRTYTSIEIICGILPFILAFDFLVRFVSQQTPAQLIKPYILLPIGKYSCIDNFIFSSLLSEGNFVWFALFIPYVIMSVIFSYGFLASIGLLFFIWIMILANSQWYSICRTLINDTLLWWILPIIAYTIIALPWIIKNIDTMFDFYSATGTQIGDHSPLPYIAAILLLIVLILINRKLQLNHIITELSKQSKTKTVNSKQYKFLERFGETGSYIQLEINLLLRNKNPRLTYIFATVLVTLFSLLISFTDIYDGMFSTNFFGIYNYVIYGAMMLIRIMCYEGNYIDSLMVRKENILSLLHAKYIIYSFLLILPFILMLPTVFSGKWSFIMLLSFAIFTSGFQYFIMFHLAIYNKQTIPLNEKFVGKGAVETNYFQLAAEMVVFFVPLAVISILQLLFGETASYYVMLLIGIAFISTHKLWLRSIYNRMMKRRYVNMNSFRNSR